MQGGCWNTSKREREREELLTFGTDGAHANEASPARETRRRNRLTRVLGDLASRIWRHAQVCCQRDWNQDERPGRNDTCLKQGKIRIRRMVTFRSLNRRYRSWPNRERFVTIWRILDFSLSISYLVRFIRVWILVGWIIFFSFFFFFGQEKQFFGEELGPRFNVELDDFVDLNANLGTRYLYFYSRPFPFPVLFYFFEYTCYCTITLEIHCY